MKTRQLLILLAALVVLGGIAILKNKRSNANWRENTEGTAKTLLPWDFDTDAVGSITIEKNDGTITIHRDDEGWKLDNRFNYPVSLDDLSKFIAFLTDTRFAQSLTATPEQLAAMGCTKESGMVTMTLSDKQGKAMKSISFGKKIEGKNDKEAQFAMYGMNNNMLVGRYVSVDGNYYIVANTFAQVDESLAGWLDPDFIKIHDLQSAAMEENGTLLWKASRSSQAEDFTLEGGDIPDGKEIDKTRLSSLKSAFSYCKFNDVADKSVLSEIGMDKPRVMTLKCFSGNTYTLTFGQEIQGKRYVNIAVKWEGAAERTPAEGEKPEDKARLDEEFAKKNEEARNAANVLQAKWNPWFYEVGGTSLGLSARNFSDFLKDIPKAEPEKQ